MRRKTDKAVKAKVLQPLGKLSGHQAQQRLNTPLACSKTHINRHLRLQSRSAVQLETKLIKRQFCLAQRDSHVIEVQSHRQIQIESQVLGILRTLHRKGYIRRRKANAHIIPATRLRTNGHIAKHSIDGIFLVQESQLVGGERKTLYLQRLKGQLEGRGIRFSTIGGSENREVILTQGVDIHASLHIFQTQFIDYQRLVVQECRHVHAGDNLWRIQQRVTRGTLHGVDEA